MHIQTLAIGCPQCGGEKFVRPENPGPEDDCTCTECGHVAKLIDLEKSFARKKALEFVKRDLANGFRKR